MKHSKKKDIKDTIKTIAKIVIFAIEIFEKK